jgi:DNA-binding transcriptional regulator WhiA
MTDTGNWETAKIVGTDEEAALVAGFLNSNGIEAEVESLHASEFPTDFGRLGEVRVKVRAASLAEAQQLLEQSETEAAAARSAEGE